ncbi:MAG: TolC family outer membrane protein [Gammaproteobacteria bacterium]|nr:TolC family outer membrane protein [Gammaproteobacteria bacterium]
MISDGGVPALLAVMLALHCGQAGAENLLDVYRLAAQHDPQYLAADAAHLAASEARTQGRALLLPTLNLNASVSTGTQEILSASAGSAYSTSVGKRYDNDTTVYGLRLVQPIFRFDSLVQQGLAGARVARAEAEFGDEQQAMMVRVAEGYFNVLAARDSVDFAEAERKSIERQLEQTRQRFKVGLVAITDVHEAQAAFDLATAQEIDARDQLASAIEALRQLTGMQHDALDRVAEEIPLAGPDPADIELWTQRALDGNLKMQAARFAEREAYHGKLVTRAGHLPNIDAVADYSRSDIKSGTFMGDREVEDTSVAVQMTMSLFAGGATQSRVRESAQRHEQAVQILEQQRRLTVRQVRDAYRSVLADIQRVMALKQAVVSAQSALKANEAGYSVGTRTSVDVLGARRELFKAQRDYSQARYRYLLDTLRLKQATGQLTAQDIELVNGWTVHG